MARIGRSLAAVIAVGLFASVSQAQPPGSGAGGVSRPVYSPYLNLVRRDASPGVNYYGLVRPQLMTQSNLQSLQQQITAGQPQRQFAGQSVVNSDLPITGQQTFFLNTGGYFLNSMAGAGPANPAVTTRSAPQPAGRR